MNVKYFGQLAEIAGNDEEQLEISDKAAVIDLLKKINELHKDSISIPLRVALDMKLADANSEILPEHEIAVLPPFAGG